MDENNVITFEFETFEDAMEVHKGLFKLLRDKHFVTYEDVCRLSKFDYGKSKREYLVYGWVNLFDSSVRPSKNDVTKWVLELPGKLIKVK